MLITQLNRMAGNGREHSAILRSLALGILTSVQSKTCAQVCKPELLTLAAALNDLGRTHERQTDEIEATITHYTKKGVDYAIAN
jgi:hypothetical protein